MHNSVLHVTLLFRVSEVQRTGWQWSLKASIVQQNKAHKPENISSGKCTVCSRWHLLILYLAEQDKYELGDCTLHLYVLLATYHKGLLC